MDKDIDNNPSLKRQYNITGNYQPAMVSSSISDETPPEKKIKKESKAVPVKKPPPALPPSAVKSPEPEKPEQQAKIGKWQPIEKPIAYHAFFTHLSIVASPRNKPNETISLVTKNQIRFFSFFSIWDKKRDSFGLFGLFCIKFESNFSVILPFR